MDTNSGMVDSENMSSPHKVPRFRFTLPFALRKKYMRELCIHMYETHEEFVFPIISAYFLLDSAHINSTPFSCKQLDQSASVQVFA